MTELVHIPVSLPDDKQPTKEVARTIIGTLLPLEWPSTDLNSLTIKWDTENANPHCVVERPSPPSGTPREPLKVFVKFHQGDGGDIVLEAFRDLAPTKQEEARFGLEYGRAGLGARMYGFFQTEDGTLGRVDEFLDARCLEPEDVEDEELRADLARGYAVFHTLKTDLAEKSTVTPNEILARCLARYHRKDSLKTMARDCGADIDAVIDYDFAARVMKVVDKLQAIGGKTGWCIHDVQYINVMVKNHPERGESRIVLIDFEFVMRNYRGFDIGGHFMHKPFRYFFEESKTTGTRPYSEEEKRHFCEVYAKEWNRINGDSDTGDQVLREAELGYMLAMVFEMHNTISHMDDTGESDPMDFKELNVLFKQFVDQYSSLGLEVI